MFPMDKLVATTSTATVDVDNLTSGIPTHPSDPVGRSTTTLDYGRIKLEWVTVRRSKLGEANGEFADYDKIKE